MNAVTATRTPGGSFAVHSLTDRLVRFIDKRADGCWQWTGSLHPNGYGNIGVQFGAGRANRRQLLAHRVSYEIHLGPIPAGLTLDHLCRNRACVNPAHLDPVSERENILRSTGPAAVNAAKTHCKRGHELTGDNLKLNKGKGGRQIRCCRECGRLHKRNFRARRAALHGTGDAA
jgi:hypothetical protein